MSRTTAIQNLVQPRILVACLLALSLLVAATFAVSSQQALSPAGESASTGDATPFLGLTYVNLSHELAARYSLRADTGVLVTEVSRGGPADLAGLRRGDILLSADSTPLARNVSPAVHLLAREPGDKMVVEVLRNGVSLTTELVIGTRP